MSSPSDRIKREQEAAARMAAEDELKARELAMRAKPEEEVTFAIKPDEQPNPTPDESEIRRLRSRSQPTPINEISDIFKSMCEAYKIKGTQKGDPSTGYKFSFQSEKDAKAFFIELKNQGKVFCMTKIDPSNPEKRLDERVFCDGKDLYQGTKSQILEKLKDKPESLALFQNYMRKGVSQELRSKMNEVRSTHESPPEETQGIQITPRPGRS